MRRAALEASAYENNTQRAISFHEERVKDIINGDHELDGGDPHLVAHIIPDRMPDPGALDAREHLSSDPPSIGNSRGFATTHQYGQITKPSAKDADQVGYNLLTSIGPIESVSRANLKQIDGEVVYAGGKVESKIAATANWAQNQYSQENGIEDLTVNVTLLDLDEIPIWIPSSARHQVYVEEPTFESSRIGPLPARIPVEETDAIETYEQLDDLFERLWVDTGLSSSPYYQNSTDAGRDIREYL